MTLKRSDESVVSNLSYVVVDANGDDAITLDDVAKGFADLINDPTLATASGSKLTYKNAAVEKVTVSVTPQRVATTALIGGTFADRWEQTIDFTGARRRGIVTR